MELKLSRKVNREKREREREKAGSGRVSWKAP